MPSVPTATGTGLVKSGNGGAPFGADPMQMMKWWSDALAHMFGAVPGLGGVFTITASENLTNCASHGNHQQCPRCRKRSDANIIAEVNATKDKRIIAYCGGGIAATLDAFLLHQLGYADIAVYDASMSEWATDDSLPIETD